MDGDEVVLAMSIYHPEILQHVESMRLINIYYVNPVIHINIR